MERNKEWFKTTSVHRDDLIQAGFDGNAVDDATMERQASKMCDDYVTQLFWEHIGVIAEHLGIPKLSEDTNTLSEDGDAEWGVRYPHLGTERTVQDYTCHYEFR